MGINIFLHCDRGGGYRVRSKTGVGGCRQLHAIGGQVGIEVKSIWKK